MSKHYPFANGAFAALAISLVLNAQAWAKENNINKIATLPQVKVSALSISDAKGYKVNASRSSTRTDTPLLDVPQAVSVVTQEQIRDQNITNMEQAVRYVPGVNIQQGEGHRDQVAIRGNASNADFFVDGARDDLQYLRDFYSTERIEFLKGPNAMAFGRGGSGGVVNRVSKFADAKERAKLVLSGGSFDNRRIEADLGNKVNDKFMLRLNAMYEQSGSYRQYVDFERSGFNPTATIILSDKTNLKLGYEHFADNRFNDRGIPSSNGGVYKVSSSAFFGNPHENDSETKIDSGYAIITHDFDSTLQVRNLTRYTVNSKYYQNVYASGAVNGAGNVALKAYNDSFDRNNFTNQTDVTKKFTTGTVKHTALMGAEITNQHSKNLRHIGYFNNTTDTLTVSASNPLTYAPITYRRLTSANDNTADVQVYAGYVQDQIDINKYLQFTGGVRLDRFEINLTNNHNSQNFKRIDTLLSPRAGLVIKPLESLSLYTSYSVTYLPAAGDQFNSLSVQTKLLKPEKMQNYEVGAKWDVNPNLNLSIALYQLDRTNTRANDPNNAGYFILTGASRSRGLELAATGKITDNWQVIGGYAYQNAEITGQTSEAAAGKRLALAPQNKFSLWNKYDLTKQFGVGLGVINQSHQFTSVDNTVRLKGFTRFDGAVYYKINPAYRMQFNIENIFDRGYVLTAHNNNNILPGSPRAFKVSLVADF